MAGINRSWRFHAAVFVSAGLLLFSRRPDALLNPQFWAEDGQLWFSDVYHYGLLPTLLVPVTGYLQVAQRLSGALAQLVPFRHAPLVVVCLALFFKILPVNYLLSTRLDSALPDLRVRALFALAYLALPNSHEVNANMANVHWHLALAAILVFFARPAASVFFKAVDALIAVLFAVSGPLAVFLVPVLFAAGRVRDWEQRRRRLFLVFLLGASAQVLCLLLASASRFSVAERGATTALFSQIVSYQVILGSLIGQKGVEFLARCWVPGAGYFHALAAAGFVVLAHACFRGPALVRVFVLFAVAQAAAALVSPVVSKTLPQWELMTRLGVSGRYWFLPMLAFLAALLTALLSLRPVFLRPLAISLLVLMVPGFAADWRYPAYADLKFRDHSWLFKKARKGDVVVIPINPPPWEMTLRKK